MVLPLAWVCVCVLCVCAHLRMHACMHACLCCFLHAGREVAGGSHRYADVKEMWRDLYLGLKDGGAAAAASTTAADRSRFALLSLVLNCDAVLQRAGAPRAGGQGGYRGSGGDAGYVGIHGGDSRKRSR